MNANQDWWESLPEERRENLNRIARRSILRLEMYPWSSFELMAELTAWSELEADIMKAHACWLSRTKARFESHGIPWTTGELMRRAHLWGHE